MKKVRNIVREYLLLTAGAFLTAIGIYFFKFPNHFSTGGVSGISIILAHYFPRFSAGAFVFIINQLLLILGFAVFGRSFGIRTAFVSVVMSGITWGLEYIFPMEAPFTAQPFLELIYAVTFPAIGSAILFNMQASSGGTDIVAMILRKYTDINIGRALLCVDFLITAASIVAFGMETGLLCVLGLAIKSLIVDYVLESIRNQKCFQIITSKPAEILHFITVDLHRGATELEGKGAYTHEDKTIILTVVNRYEAIRLRIYAKEIDPHCFMVITNSSEIIGKGFRGLN